MKPLTRLAVLGSGTGSNFIAIQNAILAGELQAVIAVVICDIPAAPILDRAKEFGLPVVTLAPSPFRTKLSPEGEADLVAILKQYEVEWVVLAGYMRVVKAPLLEAFPGRIVNIHPSLLPAFKGLRAWEQALMAGVNETGCTVHFVDKDIDGGKIIAQHHVPVLPGDTNETLHQRIHAAEHELYPATLAQLLQ